VDFSLILLQDHRVILASLLSFRQALHPVPVVMLENSQTLLHKPIVPLALKEPLAVLDHMHVQYVLFPHRLRKDQLVFLVVIVLMERLAEQAKVKIAGTVSDLTSLSNVQKDQLCPRWILDITGGLTIQMFTTLALQPQLVKEEMLTPMGLSAIDFTQDCAADHVFHWFLIAKEMAAENVPMKPPR
jgi:hypothetical protein